MIAASNLTTPRRRVNNGPVRRLLLALVLSAAAWAALAQPAPAAAAPAAAAASDTARAGDPTDSGDTDRRWNTAYRATVSVSESSWKFAGVHAGLAAARSGGPCIAAAHAAGPPDHHAHHRPSHLRHHPLLI
jgi:hypothetical protein